MSQKTIRPSGPSGTVTNNEVTRQLCQVAERTARLAADKQRQIDLDAAMEVERQKAVLSQEVGIRSP